MCSKGFYVRTYAHDIGQKLGCGAHLSALRRTRSGHFKLLPGKHVTFDMLKEGKRDEVLASMLSNLNAARGALVPDDLAEPFARYVRRTLAPTLARIGTP